MTAIHDVLRRGLDSTRPGPLLPSNNATIDPPTAVSPADHAAPPTDWFTKPASWALVNRHARCADGGLDPDQWFPVSADPGQARQEAAAAIAICTTCPVRGHCLTLSLQHWDIGQHGVWGGLIAADRARLRRRTGMPAGQTPNSPSPGQPRPGAVTIRAGVIGPRRTHGPAGSLPTAYQPWRSSP